jgi:glycosyltransferase involved in cell wall biosynthesis
MRILASHPPCHDSKDGALISVIMPAYQARPFLAEAIESILGQTFRDFELIVSDDGSTDGTAEIADSYAARDPRVRVLRNRHLGVARNGNVCLEAARFDWVARMDADDVSLPHRLERLMRAAQKAPEVVLWGGYATLIDRHGRRLREVRLGPETQAEYREQLAAGKVIYVCGPTSMMRRDLALELGGYDPRLKASVDVELMDRMAARGPVRTIPEELTLYRLHGGSISSARAAAQQSVFRYVAARNQARLEGRELGYEEYLQELAARPLPTRVLDRIAEMGRLHYRNATVHLAERRLAAAAGAAGLALLLNPGHTLRRAGRRAAIDRGGASFAPAAARRARG